ncbi:unnamed protein product [Coregonus sp. 'balchen']|nr:unnamed protein product [Coregonus sp. 'balchen']
MDSKRYTVMEGYSIMDSQRYTQFLEEVTRLEGLQYIMDSQRSPVMECYSKWNSKRYTSPGGFKVYKG